MRGRTSNSAVGRVKALNRNNAGFYKTAKTESAVLKPKKLSPVGGKKALARLDKPVRGRLDADAYKSGGAIHIKPSHRGLLTKEVGKKGLKPSNLRKEIAHDKKAGNVAKEKREVFALNAKTKFHH